MLGTAGVGTAGVGTAGGPADEEEVSRTGPLRRMTHQVRCMRSAFLGPFRVPFSEGLLD